MGVIGRSDVAEFEDRNCAQCAKGERRVLLGHRYGDGLRSGWRSVMDVVVRLHKLGLLPASVAALEGEDAEAAAGRLPRAAAPRNSSAAPSLLSRAFSRHAPTA